MNRSIFLLLALSGLFLLSACTRAAAPPEERAHEPIVGLPCEGCDAVFDGLPASLSASARLAANDEPGEALRIEGTVVDAKGQRVPGVIVYAYHTDSHGIYPRDEDRRGKPGFVHGLLRGWVQTDAEGQYSFDTIRPASYPNSDIPAHVHMHVIEPGRCTYYIDNILFEDDPLLTAQKQAELTAGRAGSGLALPKLEVDGTWIVRRDIVLGKKIPGYPGRPAS